MSAATQPLNLTRSGLIGRLLDYFELVKLRVTSLVMMTAWCGFYLAAAKNGVTSLSWTLLHAVLGIGLVAGGTAAINQVMEREADGLMRRTNRRPLPGRRMGALHAALFGSLTALGGVVYLSWAANPLTALLALATAAAYLGVYTPLKKVSPICTFLGAFPGAMPGVLGWTAAGGALGWEALALFAIVFCWQFPHFFSIAWLYREDYEEARIRMLPVVEPDGRSTARAVVLYALVLIPVSLAPVFLHMAGRAYFAGALLLGAAYLWTGVRLAALRLPATSPQSKPRARRLLQASIVYLPLLFALMMINAA